MGHIGTPNAVSKQEGAVGTGRATPQGSLCLHPPLKLPSIHTSSSYSQDTCLLTSRDMALKCHGGQQPTRVLISIISVMGSPPTVGVAPRGLGSHDPKDSFLSQHPQYTGHRRNRIRPVETLRKHSELLPVRAMIKSCLSETPLPSLALQYIPGQTTGWGAVCPVSLWSLALPRQRICFVYSPLHSLI